MTDQMTVAERAADIRLDSEAFGEVWDLLRSEDYRTRIAQKISIHDARMFFRAVRSVYLKWTPFDVLKSELERRGATVTPAPHGGDFCQENTAEPAQEQSE